jgi:hypothetical protein
MLPKEPVQGRVCPLARKKKASTAVRHDSELKMILCPSLDGVPLKFYLRKTAGPSV